MRFKAVAMVRDDAQACAIPTALLPPRMRPQTVAHVRAATERPQLSWTIGRSRTGAIRAARGATRAARPPRRVTILVLTDDAVATRGGAQPAASLATPSAARHHATAERSASGVQNLRREDTQALSDARAPGTLRPIGQLIRDPARRPHDRALPPAGVGRAGRRGLKCRWDTQGQTNGSRAAHACDDAERWDRRTLALVWHDAVSPLTRELSPSRLLASTARLLAKPRR